MDPNGKTGRDIERGGIAFEVDAGLLFELGERLVARRSIALAELIKNAFDADATRVNILFENVTRPHGTIVIDDNGSGMTLEEIRHGWMRVATGLKRDRPVSEVYCRRRTGAKGIGRFAARRLAERLVLHSVAEREDGAREKTVISFDWEKDYQPGQSLSSTPASYERQSVGPDVPTGVVLFLHMARDTWGEADIADLRRDLLTTVSPFPPSTGRGKHARGRCRPDPGFSIALRAPEFPSYEGELRDQFLTAAWGVLSGRIDANGMPHYRLVVRSTGGRHVFAPKGISFQNVKGATMRIAYFVYRSELFEDLELGVREAQRVGREQGGVRIYVDGFRVFPYGDPGDDWLELDQLRARRVDRPIVDSAELEDLGRKLGGRPYLLTPGNNQLFGVITLSQGKQPGIVVNISRERLLENDSFLELKRFVKLGVYWMTIIYARTRAREESISKRERKPKATDIITQAKQRISSLRNLGSEAKREVIQALDYAQERIKEEEAERIGELAMLRVLSSAGAAVAILDHGIRTIIDGIRAIRTDLSEKVLPHVNQRGKSAMREALSELDDWHDASKSQVSQLGVLLGPEARTRRRQLPLRESVEKAASPLRLYMRDHGIGLANEVPRNVRTPSMYEAELHSILLHILTNALKAVRARPVRRIAVRARRESDGLHIEMLDTGVGVAKEKRERVFDAFVTDSEPDLILGTGTGLGLKVVKDLVAAYGGKVWFRDPQAPWNTAIELLLPLDD